MTRLQELVEQATHKVLGVKQLDSIILAELIARECAEVARQHNLATAERSYMVHDAIKQHFGLE